MPVYCIYVIKRDGPVVAKFYGLKAENADEAKEILRPLLNIDWDDCYCFVSTSTCFYENWVETVAPRKENETQ